jgi:Methyltransferase domain
MARIANRATIWLLNVIAATSRYVVERTLPESVPSLMNRAAILDSFGHAKKHMAHAFPFLDRFEGLSLSIREALRRYPDRDLVLEFGVYKGGMINYQAKRFRNLKFVGFDSFQGLQEQWPGVHPVQTFDLGGKLPRVRHNVSLVKGWFADVVPEWKKTISSRRIPLLIHVDCDTYNATADVLKLCAEYVEHGLIFHFDDYFGFPNWRSAGYKALNEISQEQGWCLTYLSYGTKEVAILAEIRVVQS